MKMKKGLFIFFVLSFIYCEDEIFYFYQKINKTNNNIQGDNNKNNYNKSSSLNNSQDDLKKIKKEDLRDNIKENLNNTLNDEINNIHNKNIQINKEVKINKEKELINNKKKNENQNEKKVEQIIQENNITIINSKEYDDKIINNNLDEKENNDNKNNRKSASKNKYSAFIKKPNQNNNFENPQPEKYFEYINNLSKGKINILIRKYLLDMHNELKKYIPYPYDYLIAFFSGYFITNLFIFSNKKISLNKSKLISDENISIINDKLKEILKLHDNIKLKENNKPKNNIFNKIDFSKFNLLESKLNQLLKISSTRNLFSSSENAIRENICALQMNIMKKIDNTIKI